MLVNPGLILLNLVETRFLADLVDTLGHGCNNLLHTMLDLLCRMGNLGAHLLIIQCNDSHSSCSNGHTDNTKKLNDTLHAAIPYP